MKTYKGIIWTRENILPILKQAYTEWYAADFSEREHMVHDLDTYYYQPIVSEKDGKKHRVRMIHFMRDGRENPRIHSWDESPLKKTFDF